MHFSPFGSQCVFGQHPLEKLINKEPTITVYYLSNLFIPKQSLNMKFQQCPKVLFLLSDKNKQNSIYDIDSLHRQCILPDPLKYMYIYIIKYVKIKSTCFKCANKTFNVSSTNVYLLQGPFCPFPKQMRVEISIKMVTITMFFVII